MRAKLRAAIFDGFNPASLDQILSDNDRLQPNIAIGPDFGTRVNSLIDVACQEGWLIDLCGVLATARSGNEPVSSAILSVQKWLIEHRGTNEIDLQFQQDPSISAAASDAVIISGNGNQVTVYLAAGVTRFAEAGEPVTKEVPALGPNPYRGLAAFFEEDANRFFGREKQTFRLWEAFRALHETKPGTPSLRVLPILGPSGSGKSSLARAGLVPEIARHVLPTLQSPRVIVFTPTAHPLEALARILARVVTDDPAPVTKAAEFEAELRRSTDGTYEGLRRIARYVPEMDRRKLVVLVDQFEELYTLCTDPKEQDAFIGNLLHACHDAAADVSFVLTLRTDFIGSTQRHPEFNRIVTEQGIIVPAMDASELREAITKPAANAGHPFDPALVELLVQDTLGREGALPLLQFALQRLWDAIREGKDPADTFQQIGGVGGALVQEADQLYESLPERQQKIIRRAFRSMVQLGEGVGDTRRRVDLNAIVSKNDNRDEVLNVLRAFAQPNKRLVTLEGEGDDVLAEVTHEALIVRWDKIRTWLGPEHREQERFHRRLAETAAEWEDHGRISDLLWQGFNLARLGRFVATTEDDLTELEHSFFDASVDAKEEKERQRKHAEEEEERKRKDAEKLRRRRRLGAIGGALFCCWPDLVCSVGRTILSDCRISCRRISTSSFGFSGCNAKRQSCQPMGHDLPPMIESFLQHSPWLSIAPNSRAKSRMSMRLQLFFVRPCGNLSWVRATYLQAYRCCGIYRAPIRNCPQYRNFRHTAPSPTPTSPTSF